MLFNNLTKLSRVQYFKNCDYGGGGMSILLIFLMEVEEFALFFLLCQGIFQKFSYLKEKYYNLLLKTPRKRIFHGSSC